MDSGQRHFLFGITVSEIAFILFFILLLFSFFAIAKLEKENNNEKEGREQATAKAQDAVNSLRKIGEAFGKGAEIDPEEALTALKKGADAIERAAKQEQQLQELKAENERLQQEERLAKQEAAESQGELKETRGQLANLADRGKERSSTLLGAEREGRHRFPVRCKDVRRRDDRSFKGGINYPG